jgi:hypothetical protein
MRMELERAWTYLADLCQGGHRGTGTAGERAAANRVAGWLNRMGCRVERQLFWAPRATLYYGPALVMALLAGALVLGLFQPRVGLILGLAALMPLVGELLGWPLHLDLLLPKAPSQNVLGTLPSRGPARQRLILTAHLDTQRAGLLFHPRVLPWLPHYFHLSYGLLGVAMLVLGARALGMPDGATADVIYAWGGLALFLLLLVNASFLFLTGLCARQTVGANDNGSGVALALALGEWLAAHRRPGVEVLLLFTGAEEVGSRGMRRFFQERSINRGDLRVETVVINLDNLGAGHLHLLEGEGMVRYWPYDAELIRLAQLVALPGEIHRRRNLLLPTDGLIARQRGLRAITFIAFDEAGRIPHYHWVTDRLEAIDRAALARTEGYLRRYLEVVMQAGSGAENLHGWG